MEQKSILSTLILASLFISTSCSQLNKALCFETDNFTEETRIVQTSSGEKKVSYKAYLHIPYVSKPVDTDYQSLNVYVPISINGSPIDPSSAPILFDIAVGGFMSVNNSKVEAPSYRGDLALAAGYVVVAPGCRGWDNRSADGKYYGKAPAAIVDLKSAVRYIRHNRDEIPGNTEHIISVGCSAGGALSALLVASANNSLFAPYLEEVGAVDASDHVFATACYSPITDLEHADMAYEWMFGLTLTSSRLVDQELSEQLKSEFSKYQLSLNLQGKDGFGILTAENYRDYLTTYYLVPSLTIFLIESPDARREKYLQRNSWIRWENGLPNFKFEDYVTHIGRMKGLPAFDDFGKGQPEPLLFGNDTINARHFTDFSLRYTSKNIDANVEEEVQKLVNMMNVFYFLKNDKGNVTQHWWLRNGTSDNHTSQTVMINLATMLENMDKNVNTWVFWDGDHCADNDPEGFIEWIKNITEDKED